MPNVGLSLLKVQQFLRGKGIYFADVSSLFTRKLHFYSIISIEIAFIVLCQQKANKLKAELLSKSGENQVSQPVVA